MKTKTWIVLLLVGIFVVLPIIGFFIKVVLLPFFAVGKGVDSAYEIVDKTLDADNVIYNYEWFKSRFEAIKATENKRDIAKQTVVDFREFAGDRVDWTFEDKGEYSRLSAVHQGISNHLEDLVAEYNAKSKMANRSIFKDGLIPSAMEFSAGLIK